MVIILFRLYEKNILAKITPLMPILRLQSRVMSLECRYPSTIISRCPECSSIAGAQPCQRLSTTFESHLRSSIFNKFKLQVAVAGDRRSVTPSTAGYEAGENFHVYFSLHKRDPAEADVSTFIPQGVAFRAPHERPPLPNSFIPTSLGTSRTM